MTNILPFRRTARPKPLTKVDVSRYPITNPFVQSLFAAGFRPKTYGNVVLMVSP